MGNGMETNRSHKVALYDLDAQAINRRGGLDLYSTHKLYYLEIRCIFREMDFRVYPCMKLVKYEGKLGFAYKKLGGYWEIWLLTIDESWVKTYVLNNTKGLKLAALYDTDTSIMLNFFEVLYYRFKSGDKSSNRAYVSSARLSGLVDETFIFRSDLDATVGCF
ncbi:hypothetical protein Hanom_Chr04g00340611 [Helianthus anomalus]